MFKSLLARAWQQRTDPAFEARISVSQIALLPVGVRVPHCSQLIDFIGILC